MAVFADVVRKNLVIRSAYFFYSRASAFIKSYLLILYGLKCYLSANCRGSQNPDILFFASYPNERVAIGHLRRHLGGLSAGDIRLSKANCFRPGALLALPRFLCAAARWQRFARRLVRRLPFMPACRVFSTVAYYARFRRLLARRGAKAVFIANHYSPECLALAAVAHRAGLKVLFTNHANATWWKAGFVPALHCDLVAATSEAIVDTYAKRGERSFDCVFVPQASPQAPMRCRFEACGQMTVGIFLTALTSMTRLQALVGRLQADPKVSRILIRSHPVKVVNEDLSALSAEGEKVMETSAMALAENIDFCDLAICGNSTVAIELLRGGLPVFYDADLDGLAHDYNGYLERDLILPLPAALDGPALQALGRFYDDPRWAARMRYFDAGYQRDEAAMFRQLNTAVRRALQVSLPAEAKPYRQGMPAETPYPAAAS